MNLLWYKNITIYTVPVGVSAVCLVIGVLLNMSPSWFNEASFWPPHLCCHGALLDPRGLLIYLLPYLFLFLSQDPDLSLRVTVGYQV